MRYMEDLKEMLCEELKDIAQKGELSTGTLDVIDKLTHSVKSIVTILAMEGYSGDDRRSYDGEGSYRRGRSATTGRFVSRDSGRYSRDGMKEKLEEMAQNAPDDHTRQELQRLISKM